MSEGIYWGAGNPQPGGGTGEEPKCLKQADSRLFGLALACTIEPEHEGWCEAGIGNGLMVATWTDEEPSHES